MLRKHEDLRLGFQHVLEKLGVPVSISTEYVFGEGYMEISWVCWPASLAQSVLSRFSGDPVSKIRQRAIEEDTSVLDVKPSYACMHTHVYTYRTAHTGMCKHVYTTYKQ